MAATARSRLFAHRRLVRRLVVLLAVPLAVAFSGPGTTASAAEEPVEAVAERDPAVRDAERRLEEAEQVHRETATLLDAAAAEFEEAWAQSERLGDEAADLHAGQEELAEAAEGLRRRSTDRAVAAYLVPRRQLQLSQMVLGTTDAGTALHLMGVIEHFGERSDLAIALADRVERRRADEVRQQHVVATGVRRAAEQRRTAAERLTAALDEATDVVEAADRELTSSRSEAVAREEQRRREKAEEEARAARERQERARQAALMDAGGGADAAAAAASTPAPQAVAGRVCPVGSPNGFIDSWGFPRSGGRSHRGIDIFATKGTPLYAVDTGDVRVGSNSLGGLTIHLTADNGDRFYYAHLDTALVISGDRVAPGDAIGTVGNSGNARTTPPHLHWQYHPEGGAAVNPHPLSTALCR